MRERDLTNAGSDEENERGRECGEGKGRKRKGRREKERRRRKIEEDHEDGCIGRARDAGDARGEGKSYVEAEARTAEVKRNDNGRKSGGHRWMKKQKDIDDGG